MGWRCSLQRKKWNKNTLDDVSIYQWKGLPFIRHISSVESQKGAIAVQRCYCHRLCTAIAPFWFSTEHLWTAIMSFWLSTDDILIDVLSDCKWKAFDSVSTFNKSDLDGPTCCLWHGVKIKPWKNCTSKASFTQGSTLAVARWPGATRNWCRANKNFQKKLHFGGPIGQLKFQGDDVMRITSYGAEYYRHSLPIVKANTRHLF